MFSSFRDLFLLFNFSVENDVPEFVADAVSDVAMLIMVLHVVDFDLFEVAAFSGIADVMLRVMAKVINLVAYHES